MACNELRTYFESVLLKGHTDEGLIIIIKIMDAVSPRDLNAAV